MKLMTLALMGLLGSAACGDSKNDSGDFATVSGRLAAGSADGASIYTVDDDGRMVLAASGDVTADGHFAIDGINAGDGPFIVRVMTGADVTGDVIVPEDLGAGDDVTTAPIDDETTVEAQALVAVLAGEAERDDVDSVSLMTWIDAGLAARVHAGGTTAATLGNAFMVAQETSLAVTGASAKATEGASFAAWAQLTARLDAATTDAARAEAWSEFHADVSAALDSELDVGTDAQADATAGAGFVFQDELALTDADDDAARVSAVLGAYADLAAQREAIDGSSAEAAVRARLDASYQTFFAATTDAATRAEVDAAWQALVMDVAGDGELTSDSALGLLVEGEDNGELDQANAAIGATGDAAVNLRASLDAALDVAADARADAIADAYADYRAEVAAAVDASTELSATTRAFASDAATQLGGHGSVVLDLALEDLFAGFLVGTLHLTGDVAAGLGFQAGADGAVSSTFDALAGATTAVLLSVSATGQVTEVDQGALTGSGFDFDDVADASGTLVVELRDAGGAVTGAVILDGASTADADAPTLTEETTAEALVWLDLVAHGNAGGDGVDRAWLETVIDAAVAATIVDQDDVDSVATAVAVSSAVRAQLLGATEAATNEAGMAALVELHGELEARGEAAATSWTDFRADLAGAVMSATGASAEVYARAQTEAALVFEAVIEASEGADSDLAMTAEARARIEAALALGMTIGETFDGSSFANSEAGLDAAIDTFVTATHDAGSEAGLDAAAAAFVDGVIVFDGTSSGGVLGDLELVESVDVALRTIVDASFEAAANFRASFVSGLGDGTSVDEDATANLITQASAAFASSLDLSVLLWSEADQRAMASVITQLALGFHDAY